MIEFTILLDDSDLHFEPARSTPDLAFVLPPTARIDRDNDIVHLAPIPVHCFFNGMTFTHWLSRKQSLSTVDAFTVYMTHDMFKSLLQLVPKNEGPHRYWLHASQLFNYLPGTFDSVTGLDNPPEIGCRVFPVKLGAEMEMLKQELLGQKVLAASRLGDASNVSILWSWWLWICGRNTGAMPGESQRENPSSYRQAVGRSKTKPFGLTTSSGNRLFDSMAKYKCRQTSAAFLSATE